MLTQDFNTKSREDLYYNCYLNWAKQKGIT